MNTPDQIKSQLYVGCGLTHAPVEFRESVERVKLELENEWEVMKFLGLNAGTAGDVYEQDIGVNVRNCHAFLAIADHPATGLGWELGVADERKTPTLIVSKIGAGVTRLILGAAERRHHVAFETYESMAEIPSLVRTHLRPMVK